MSQNVVPRTQVQTQGSSQNKSQPLIGCTQGETRNRSWRMRNCSEKTQIIQLFAGRLLCRASKDQNSDFFGNVRTWEPQQTLSRVKIHRHRKLSVTAEVLVPRCRWGRNNHPASGARLSASSYQLLMNRSATGGGHRWSLGTCVL